MAKKLSKQEQEVLTAVARVNQSGVAASVAIIWRATEIDCDRHVYGCLERLANMGLLQKTGNLYYTR